MSKTKEILAERGAKYGDFKDHAKICQDLKGVMNSVEGWSRLNPSQKQALEVIADKIARMLNGDPNYDDNWQDIIGYSQLVLNEINEHGGQTKMSFDLATGNDHGATVDHHVLKTNEMTYEDPVIGDH